jgi:hypothetical protein
MQPKLRPYTAVARDSATPYVHILLDMLMVSDLRVVKLSHDVATLISRNVVANPRTVRGGHTTQSHRCASRRCSAYVVRAAAPSALGGRAVQGRPTLDYRSSASRRLAVRHQPTGCGLGEPTGTVDIPVRCGQQPRRSALRGCGPGVRPGWATGPTLAVILLPVVDPWTRIDQGVSRARTAPDVARSWASWKPRSR